MVGEVPPGDDAEWPLMLSAGERRSFTANTIIRDPLWRKKDEAGALRVSPHDAERLGLADGGTGLITTKRGAARVVVSVDDGDAARPRVAAERPRTRSCRGWRPCRTGRHRSRTERADGE